MQLLNKIRTDSNLKGLLQDSGLLYISGLLSIGLIFFQQITTATLLGAESYGKLAIILSIGLTVTILLDFRTWEIGSTLLAGPIQLNQHHESVRMITWLYMVDLIAGLFGIIGLVIISDVIASRLIDEPELAWVLRIYSISIPLRLLASGVLGALPRYFNRFSWLAIKSSAYALIRCLLMTGAAFFGFGVIGVVIAALLSEILHVFMLLIMGGLLWKDFLQESSIIDFTRPSGFAQGVKMLPVFWLNTTLIGLHLNFLVPFAALFISPMQIGVFSAGLAIMELIDKAIQPLWVVFTPKLIMLYQSADNAAFTKYLRQVIVVSGSIVISLSILILVSAPFLLPILLPQPEYQGVVAVVVVLVLSNSIYAGLMWTRPVIISLAMISQHNFLTLCALSLSTFSVVILAPVYGFVGIAFGKAIFLVISGIGSLLLIRNHIKF